MFDKGFDKTKVEKTEEKAFALHKDLNTLLKASEYNYRHGDNFYNEYTQFISKLSETYEGLQAYCQQQLTEYATKQEESRAKAKKDGDFFRTAEDFIKERTDELIKKNKFIDEVKGKMRESLTGLDSKKVAKLKVNENESLKNFWAAIFKVYYKDAKDTFEWSKFKKAVVEKDKLDDFQGRLLSVDFSTLTVEDTDLLAKVKDDAWIEDFSKTKKEGSAVVELLNYLEFVKEAARAQSDINRLHDEIDRIKADAPHRGESSKTESQWAELLSQNIAHLDSLNDRLVKSAEPFADENRRTAEQVQAYNQHKAEIQSQLVQEYPRVQTVDKSIFADA